MSEKSRDRISQLVRPLFPPEALITPSAGADDKLILSVGWRLGPNRMDNWSKEIRLVISSKIVDRYGKLNEKGRRKAEGNLLSFVQAHLSKFNPHHDRPRYLLPPVEIWELTYEEMFPKAG